MLFHLMYTFVFCLVGRGIWCGNFCYLFMFGWQLHIKAKCKVKLAYTAVFIMLPHQIPLPTKQKTKVYIKWNNISYPSQFGYLRDWWSKVLFKIDYTLVREKYFTLYGKINSNHPHQKYLPFMFQGRCSMNFWYARYTKTSKVWSTYNTEFGYHRARRLRIAKSAFQPNLLWKESRLEFFSSSELLISSWSLLEHHFFFWSRWSSFLILLGCCFGSNLESYTAISNLFCLVSVGNYFLWPAWAEPSYSIKKGHYHRKKLSSAVRILIWVPPGTLLARPI